MFSINWGLQSISILATRSQTRLIVVSGNWQSNFEGNYFGFPVIVICFSAFKNNLKI